MTYSMSDKIEVAGVAISGGNAVEFVCHYARSFDLTKDQTIIEDVSDEDTFNGQGQMKYELVGEALDSAISGSTVTFSIKALHNNAAIFAK